MLFPEQRIILSLCDYTGVISEPWRLAGYDVRQYDTQLDPSHDLSGIVLPEEPLWGVLAQPPCTHLARSGARHWKRKDTETPELLREASNLVAQCVRIAAMGRARWLLLENPVGRINRFIGPPVMYIQPHDYAGWADDPGSEAYTKKTGLWGWGWNAPIKRPLEPVLGSKMHLVPPGPDRANIRSKTPQGFARAFYEANK